MWCLCMCGCLCLYQHFLRESQLNSNLDDITLCNLCIYFLLSLLYVLFALTGSQKMAVSGVVQLPRLTLFPRHSYLYITLEDITPMDVSSAVLEKKKVNNIHLFDKAFVRGWGFLTWRVIFENSTLQRGRRKPLLAIARNGTPRVIQINSAKTVDEWRMTWSQKCSCWNWI